MGSGATNFTGASTQYYNFSRFYIIIHQRWQNEQFSKLLNKIKSTESYTRDMVLKFLPEPSHELKIFPKNYQALYQPDKLVMHLT